MRRTSLASTMPGCAKSMGMFCIGAPVARCRLIDGFPYTIGSAGAELEKTWGRRRYCPPPYSYHSHGNWQEAPMEKPLSEEAYAYRFCWIITCFDWAQMLNIPSRAPILNTSKWKRHGAA